MKILKLFGYFTLLAFTLCLLTLVFLLDISQKELDVDANPDLANAKPGRPPVYLVSYADGDEIYFRNQNALALSALGRGVDHTLNYRRSLLNPKFVKDHRQILNMSQGSGGWLWKPWIILDALNKAPEGAIIIYVDTGFIFHKSFSGLLKKLDPYDLLIISYDHSKYGSVRSRVQRKTLELMKADSDSFIKDRSLMMAGFIIVRNTSQGRGFIQKWLEHCSDPQKLLPYSHQSKPEYPGFRAHHYDLSILTVLTYLEQGKGYIKTLDETHVKPYISWHHRSNRAGINDRSLSYFLSKSLLYLRPVFSFVTSTLKIAQGIVTGQRSFGELFYRPFVALYKDTHDGVYYLLNR